MSVGQDVDKLNNTCWMNVEKLKLLYTVGRL